MLAYGSWRLTVGKVKKSRQQGQKASSSHHNYIQEAERTIQK